MLATIIVANISQHVQISTPENNIILKVKDISIIKPQLFFLSLRLWGFFPICITNKISHKKKK